MDPFARLLTYLFLMTAMLGIGRKAKGADIRSTLGEQSLMVRSLQVENKVRVLVKYELAGSIPLVR